MRSTLYQNALSDHPVGPRAKTLGLFALVRLKLKSRWFSFLLMLVVYLVFFQLSSRQPPKLPALEVSTNIVPLVRDKVADNLRPTTVPGGRARLIGDDILAPKGVNSYSMSSNINADDGDSRNFRIAQRSGRGGFLFVFRYYEQLGRATDNLINLASLAKYNDRQVVAPFVNNSRMSGLRGGAVSHGGRNKTQTDFRFATLDAYFDVSQINSRLQSRGYATLTDFDHFEEQCKGELDLLVLFLYAPVRTSPVKDLMSWFKLTRTEVEGVYEQTRKNRGWGECPFIRKLSKAAQLLSYKVRRYVCINTEVVTSAHELEGRIFNRAKCVAFVQWKGMGEGRTHFPLHPSITRRLKPSDLDFNPALVKIATKFVQEKLGGTFIAVHVRSERHLVWMGVSVTLRCIHHLGRRVYEAQAFHKIPKLFLSHDLADHGSDTLVGDSKSSDRKHLSRSLHKYLNQPTTFSPLEFGVYDHGAAAIIEMNVLAMATRLFTLGGGNFQEWVVDLFSLRNEGRKTRVHRMCEMS